MKTFPTLLKREYWEHKGGFLWAPVVCGGIFILFNILAMAVGQVGAGRHNIQLGTLRLNEVTASMSEGQLATLGLALDTSILVVAWLVGVVTAIVVFFYCLASLYDERRDRSVLFWKSLPVSDAHTVLSKAFSALIVAPVIGTVVGVATGLAFLLVAASFLAFNGVNAFGLILSHASPIKMIAMLLAQVPMFAIWALPTVGWLMLCSAWARSKPFLWAVGLPIAAGILVSWLDVMRTLRMPDTSIWSDGVARILLSVLPGSWFDTSVFQDGATPEQVMSMLTVGHSYAALGQLSTWTWAAAGVAMIVLAARLRRWRDEG